MDRNQSQLRNRASTLESRNFQSINNELNERVIAFENEPLSFAIELEKPSSSLLRVEKIIRKSSQNSNNINSFETKESNSNVSKQLHQTRLLPHEYILKYVTKSTNFKVEIGNPNYCSLCKASRCEHTLFLLRELYCVDDPKIYFQHCILDSEVRLVQRRRNKACPICLEDIVHMKVASNEDNQQSEAYHSEERNLPIHNFKNNEILVWCRGCGHTFHHKCQVRSMGFGNDSCSICKRSFHPHWMRGFQTKEKPQRTNFTLILNSEKETQNKELNEELQYGQREHTLPSASLSIQSSDPILTLSPTQYLSQQSEVNNTLQHSNNLHSTESSLSLRNIHNNLSNPRNLASIRLSENIHTHIQLNNQTHIKNQISSDNLINQSSSLGSVHTNSYCMECMMQPIEGRRYRCRICPRYSICSKCYHLKKHDHHPFEYRDLHYSDENYGWKLPRKQNSKAANIREKLKKGTERLKTLMESAARERLRYLSMNNSEQNESIVEFEDNFDLDSVLAQYSIEPIERIPDPIFTSEQSNIIINHESHPHQSPYSSYQDNNANHSYHESNTNGISHLNVTHSTQLEPNHSHNQLNLIHNDNQNHSDNSESRIENSTIEYTNNNSQNNIAENNAIESRSIPNETQLEDLSTSFVSRRFSSISLSNQPQVTSTAQDLYQDQNYVGLEQLPTRILTSEDLKNSMECSICLENYKPGDEIRTLFCFHFFHKDCIDSWFNSSHKAICCICKTEQKILLKSLRYQNIINDVDPTDTETLNILLHRQRSRLNPSISTQESNSVTQNMNIMNFRRNTTSTHSSRNRSRTSNQYSHLSTQDTSSLPRLIPNRVSNLSSLPNQNRSSRRNIELFGQGILENQNTSNANNNHSRRNLFTDNVPRNPNLTTRNNSVPSIHRNQVSSNNSPSQSSSISRNNLYQRPLTRNQQSRDRMIPVEISLAIGRLSRDLRTELINIFQE